MQKIKKIELGQGKSTGLQFTLLPESPSSISLIFMSKKLDESFMCVLPAAFASIRKEVCSY